MPGGGAPLLARLCDFRIQCSRPEYSSCRAAVPAPSDVSQLMHGLLRDVHLAMHHTDIDIEEDPTCFDHLRSALFACLNLLPCAGDEAETQAATPSNFQVCGVDAPVADAEDIWPIIYFRNLTTAYILEFSCMCIHIERYLCYPAC